MTTKTTTQTRTARAVSVEQIPDKMYFRIGEVAEIVAVKAHVLRYWEKEFSLLKPQKSRAGQRMYRRRDVEILLHIRSLLYDRGYTIAGAAKMLKGGLTHLPPLGPVSGADQAAEHNAQALSGPQRSAETKSSLGSAPSGSDQAAGFAPSGAQSATANAVALATPSAMATARPEPNRAPTAEQLALALQKDPLISRKKEIVRVLKGLIALCDHTDAHDIDPFAQLRQDRQRKAEQDKQVVVATSRRQS